MGRRVVRAAASGSLPSRARLLARSSIGQIGVNRRRSKKLPFKRPVALPQVQDGVGAPLPTPEVGVPAPDGTNREDIFAEACSTAELGVKLFPSLQPHEASAFLVGLVHDATTCIKYYNSKYKTNFAHKHAFGNGFYRVLEQDGSCYYHMNFQAQDKDGHIQLFFGEIMECALSQVENVTCCCTVSSSDDGGRSIRSIEEAMKHALDDWDSVVYDYEHCYACTSRVKHPPNGNCYIAGHFADSRQYYGFLD